MVSTSPYKYFCHACDKYFTCASSLRTHKDSINGKKQHKYSFCGDTIGYQNALQRHIKKQHSDQRYPAASLDVINRSPSVLAKNLDQVMSGQLLTSPDNQLIQRELLIPDGIQATQHVPVATATYTHNEQSISSGTKRHLPYGPKQRYPCTGCGKRFTSLRNAQRHKNSAHSNQNYSCGVCGRFFKNFFQCLNSTYKDTVRYTAKASLNNINGFFTRTR